MTSVHRLSPDDFLASVPGLASVLANVVADGASVGFLPPFDVAAAAAWWHAQHPAVADGSLGVWVARGDDGIAGTVSLVMEGKPNGRHRGEIVKLLVHPNSRGGGLGRALLATAERAAVRAGATLVLLDTETGSAAESLYCDAGWTRYGIVPEYAAGTDGVLHDGSFFYKRFRA